MKYLQVFVTIDSQEKAENIAKSIVEMKLAACAQVSGPIKSFYWWQGKVEHSDEWYIILKTTDEKFDQLEKTIKELHPYKVPEIIAHEIINANKDYLDWIKETLS